ncbi:MAG: hypothetical protein PHT07_19455 [Paludibacter sp.]|nr:hypothetical protein [Paludibacter sp.]
MIHWINNRFGTNYSEVDLNEIKNFTLLWNIYENTIFNTRFSINRLETEINRRNLDFQPFQVCFEYFQNRYIENNDINQRFPYLNFRQNDKEQLVRNVLLGLENSDNDKILTLGIVVYRLRNNLFHGIKDYHNLNGQADNFTHANIFIQQFLGV